MAILIGTDATVSFDENRPPDTSGAFLQESVEASPARLVEAFGLPSGTGDDSGRRGDYWLLTTPDGTAMLYAWDRPEVAEGEQEDADAPVRWCVAARDALATSWVSKVLDSGTDGEAPQA